MKGYLFGGAALLAAAVEAAVDPIVVNGKHFFYKTNQTEFFVRGIAYQQDAGGDPTGGASGTTNADSPDPLADTSACMRDIPYLLALRTNVLRTYAVNPTNDHSGCMNAFAAAGIYIISDLSTTSASINRDTPSWTVDLYNHYTAVIDDLSQYTNTLGFFAGNEVSNSANTTAASAFVKAAVRDSKAYIAKNVDRPMYVGYATYDGDIRDLLIEYFNCGEPSDAIDFWGYNVYSWCGISDYVTSNYQARTQFLEDINIPAIFAEYGCKFNGDTPIIRPFDEVQALFGYNMTPVWSGGIVYQYFQSQNDYGLVNISGNSVVTNQDYDNLSSQMAKASPTSVKYSAVNTGTAFSCPTVDATWLALATPLPPPPNAALCDCVTSAASCVVKNSTDTDGYGDLFNFVCGGDPDLCTGILANATTGDYGAYGGCGAEQQLDYVLQKYYQANSGNNGGASACDFGGSASLQSTTITGSCSALIASAGTSGQNTLSTSVGGGGGGSTSPSNNAGISMHGVVVENSYLYLGLYVLGSIATGAGALIL